MLLVLPFISRLPDPYVDFYNPTGKKSRINNRNNCWNNTVGHLFHLSVVIYKCFTGISLISDFKSKDKEWKPQDFFSNLVDEVICSIMSISHILKSDSSNLVGQKRNSNSLYNETNTYFEKRFVNAWKIYLTSLLTQQKLF